MPYLLDTCAISELGEERPDLKVKQALLALPREELHLSTITLGEIQYGIALLPDSSKKSRLISWLNLSVIAVFADRTIPVDAFVALHWGDLLAQLRLRGLKMQVKDSLMRRNGTWNSASLSSPAMNPTSLTAASKSSIPGNNPHPSRNPKPNRRSGFPPLDKTLILSPPYVIHFLLLRGVIMSSFDQVVHAKAIEIGKLSVRATTAAGSGHPSTSLSLAHITTVLMYHAMRWDPEHPHHHGSDRLVLSEGHAVPIIYAACADIGVTFYPGGKAKIMNTEDLLTLREIKSPIDGHPNPPVGFPFFDAATGSLGQGLSAAGGLAAAARVDKHGKVIYCIIGDGESREGQIWEAMDFIAEHKLTNVVAIFNSNEIAQSDYVAPAQTADHLAAKAAAFGWKVVVVDGHNPSDLIDALKLRTEAMVAGKPLCIVAKTVKGWGAASQQGLGHHGTPVTEKELPHVLAELDQTGVELGVNQVSPDEIKRVLRIHPPLQAPAHHGAHKAMTLSEAAEKHKMVPRR